MTNKVRQLPGTRRAARSAWKPPEIEIALRALKESLRREVQDEIDAEIRLAIRNEAYEEFQTEIENLKGALEEAESDLAYAEKELEERQENRAEEEFDERDLLLSAVQLLVSDRSCPTWIVDSQRFIQSVRSRLTEHDYSEHEFDNRFVTVFEGKAARQ